MNGHDRILTVLDTGAADCLAFMPITMMFAADHAGLSYREYALDHHALVEAQLRVAEDFDFDFVSAISDPAREAADCGAAVRYFADQPPAIDESNALLADTAQLARLTMPAPLGGGRMHDRVCAVALFQEQVGGEKLIEGWIEGPCAEAADLRGINTLMMDFYEDPVFVRDLFDFTVELGLRFGRAQIEAGAGIIGIGDAAASLVGPQLYEEFVWPAEQRLVKGLKECGARVRLHICGDVSPVLHKIGQLDCDIVDLDFPVSIAAAREAMGEQQVLLGNIDPVRALRDGTPESVHAAVAECHQQAGARYIVSAGCEVPRGTPPENLRAMHRYAREHGAAAPPHSG